MPTASRLARWRSVAILRGGCALLVLLFAVRGAQAAPRIETSGLVRVQGVSWDGYAFGPRNFIGEEDVVLLRAYGDVNAHWSDHVSTHLEVAYHEQDGRRVGSLPTDTSGLDVQQAYLDLSADRANLRLGRQEVMMGTGRFFSLRDGTNIRRVLDGALLDVARGRLKYRAFAFRPVRAEYDWFDDETDNSVDIYGGQLGFTPRTGHGVELLLFTYQERTARYARVAGSQERNTLAARMFDDVAPLDWNVELAWQWGEMGGQDIAAWMVAGDAGWRFAHTHGTPRLGVKFNITSGDRNPDDGRFQTFDGLYSSLYPLAQMALLAPINYADVQPNFTLQLSPRLSLRLRANWYWRMSTAETMYLGGRFPVRTAPDGHFGAQQLDAELTLKATRALELYLGYSDMHIGQALRDVGGEDMQLIVLMTTYRF